MGIRAYSIIQMSYTEKEKVYGWFSREAFNSGITHHWYSVPSGHEVLVTCVNNSSTDSQTGWTDIQCVGEVTAYVRQEYERGNGTKYPRKKT